MAEMKADVLVVKLEMRTAVWKAKQKDGKKVAQMVVRKAIEKVQCLERKLADVMADVMVEKLD